MLQAREQVPHFSVKDTDGTEVGYDLIWQRKNLLLVLLDDRDPAGAGAYLDHLRAHMTALTDHDTACIVTADRLEGAPCPGVIIADRWGEIWHVYATGVNADLPRADGLIEWLRYVQMQCPECQGETR